MQLLLLRFPVAEGSLPKQGISVMLDIELVFKCCVGSGIKLVTVTMANVATVTSTRIDSGCKHIIPTKVSHDHILMWTKYDANKIFREKMNYCSHKDDMLLCVNKPLWLVQSGSTYSRKHAYPAVVSTLADMDYRLKYLLGSMYDDVIYQRDLNRYVDYNFQDEEALFRDAETGERAVIDRKDAEELKIQWRQMPDFTFMGYALTLAQADSRNGDTVTSALIGGMMTVRNGRFPIKTGDMIQFYFEFEENFFDDNGRRRPKYDVPDGPGFEYDERYYNNNHTQFKPDPLGKRISATGFEDFQTRNSRSAANDLDRDGVDEPYRKMPRLNPDGTCVPVVNSRQQDKNTERRKAYQERGLGRLPNEKNLGKRDIAYIKPFFHMGPWHDRLFDKRRVFGKAVSNARPWDMVDILICRQSI